MLTDERGSIYFRGVRTLPVKRDARWIGRRSIYVEHGDWFVAVCAALAGLGWLALRKNDVPGVAGPPSADEPTGPL